LNASTGSFKWSYTTGSVVYSSPAVVNGIVYIGSEDGKVYALNASTGGSKWSYNTFSVVDSSPAVANGMVYFGSFNDKVYALNASTGSFKWSYTTGSVIESSAAVANGIVYIDSYDKNVYGLNASTGSFKWSYTTGNVIEHGSPATSNGVVYSGSEDGNVYALNATSGTKIWSYTTRGLGSSSPAIAGGTVYIGGSSSVIYALNASTGAPEWLYGTGNSIAGSPAIVNGVLYIGSTDDDVYAIGINNLVPYGVGASTGVPCLGQSYTISVYWTVNTGVLSEYIFGTDNSGHWQNSSAVSFPNTQSAWSNVTIVLNSTVTTSGFPSVHWEIWAESSLGLWGCSLRKQTITPTASPLNTNSLTKAMFSDMVAAEVNSTFPYTKGGSSSYTSYASQETLGAVSLYTQTLNVTYLKEAEKTANWLESQPDIRRIFLGYTLSSRTWDTQYAVESVGYALMQLALIAQINSTYKPLLQSLANILTAHCINYTDNIAYPNLYVSNNLPYGTYVTIDVQTTVIDGLIFASQVLGNVTLKNIAYNLIISWAYGSPSGGILPAEVINVNNGTIDYGFSPSGKYIKEDQGIANYLYAMEEFLYFYPNATISARLGSIAWATGQYVWNSLGFWNYMTNCLTGATYYNYPVHGFGMVDESMLIAGLLKNNSTWITEAQHDWTYCVIQGNIIQNGLVEHSPTTSEEEDSWGLYARRAGIILYDYTHNATYLKYANFLVLNASEKLYRIFGYSGDIHTTPSYSDWTVNIRVPLIYAALVLNRTGVSIVSWSSVFAFFGLPQLGDPLIPTCTVSPTVASLDVRQTQVFSCVANGSSPYVYQWYLNGSAVASSSSYSFSAVGAGVSRVWCNVTDSTALTVESNIVIITVNNMPLVNISPSSKTLDVGQYQVFVSSISGGTSPYTYQWYLNGTLQGTGISYTFSASSKSSADIYLNVTDNVGIKVESNTVIVIVNIVPSVSISPSSKTFDVGQSQAFASNTVGGTSPYTYQWYLNGSVQGTSLNWTFTPSSSGIFNIYLNVTDNVGIMVKSNIANIIVHPAPSNSARWLANVFPYIFAAITIWSLALVIGIAIVFLRPFNLGDLPFVLLMWVGILIVLVIAFAVLSGFTQL